MKKMKDSCLGQFWVILCACATFAGLLELLIGAIIGVTTGHFIPELLWTGFGFYVGGKFFTLINSVIVKAQEGKDNE